MCKVGIWSAPAEANFEKILEKAMLHHGGWESFIKPGDLVLIKANEFIAAPASSGKTTHPALVLAVAKAARKAGAGEVIVGDLNDSIFRNFGPCPEIYDYAKLVNFGDLPHEHMMLPGAQTLKTPVPMPKVVKECDVFINMPGLRTHALPLFSNAMKNLMGFLSLGSTTQVHMWGVEGSVVDLNAFRPSDLVITDAIWSLQGNFPSEGDPLLTELILIGDNALAVDQVAAKLMRIDSEQVSFLKEGFARGLGPAIEEIEIIGDGREILGEGIYFIPPDLEFKNKPQGLRVVDRGVCNICRRALTSGLAAAQNNPEFQEPGRALAVTGTVENLEPEPGEDVILVGNCTMAHRGPGRMWLPGCPPLAGQCRTAFLSLKGKSFKTSYCSIGMRDLPLEEVIELIGPLGYEGLEIWGKHLEDYLENHSFVELKTVLAKFDLAVPMIAPYFNLVSGAEELEKSRVEAKRFIGYAKELDCPWIRVFTGPVASKDAAHWMWAQATEELKQFAAWGEKAGVGFAVETHQGQLADTVSSTLRLVMQVDKTNFRVNLDIHNLFDMGEEPVRALKQLAHYVVHVHAKNGEVRDRLRYGVPLAKGNMDYQPFFRELKRQNFGGFVSVEWFGEEPLKHAKKEHIYLQSFRK